MSAPIYDCSTEGAVALSAATARTIIGVKAHANSGIQVVGLKVGFDGVTASAVPVLIELGYCTFTTKSPGTNSTSTTPRQRNGRVLTAGFTSGTSWAAANEPTTITVQQDWLLTPNGGALFYDFPLGTEPDTALGEGYVIRCTAPAAVNVRAVLSVTRI